MCDEAQSYLDGDRAQGELFGDEERKTRGTSSEPEKIGEVVGRIGKSRTPAAATT